MKTPKKVLLVSLLVSSLALAAAEDSDTIADPNTLDGVPIEAVETYINPKTHELSLGVGLFPFNAYYTGFAANLGYTTFFTNTLAWEVVNGTYAFSVQKDLTAQLADNYNVNPSRIEKLNYLVSSNLAYTFSYGKSVLLKQFIRYYRSSLLGGVGLVSTTVQSSAAGTIGFQFDGYINERFSWRFEARDYIALNSGTNFISFNVGTGIFF